MDKLLSWMLASSRSCPAFIRGYNNSTKHSQKNSTELSALLKKSKIELALLICSYMNTEKQQNADILPTHDVYFEKFIRWITYETKLILSECCVVPCVVSSYSHLQFYHFLIDSMVHPLRNIQQIEFTFMKYQSNGMQIYFAMPRMHQPQLHELHTHIPTSKHVYERFYRFQSGNNIVAMHRFAEFAITNCIFSCVWLLTL